MAFKQYNPGYTTRQMATVLHKYLGLPEIDTMETELRAQARAFILDDGSAMPRSALAAPLDGGGARSYSTVM